MNGYNVLQPLRHDDEKYDVGAFINSEKIKETQALRLLKLKVIEPAVKIGESEAPVKVVGDLKTLGGEDEPVEETLDLNFDTNELKEGATELELEFKHNISKKALIKIIVEAGHANHFLDQLED
ncbi:hypothetical protein LG296_01645 [Ureibacillus chungkukjangi]|uniref:hypothetical protein n=1 Tax=Ureibacillus chungkukjangi TaxID=1202712 RepID=UPI00384EB9AF